MDTSRPNSADEQKIKMTSNLNANNYAYQESAYHQKPPSFNHKQVNISLVDDGASQQTKQKVNKEKQTGTEWRESIPIKLEHFLFNFKENSSKVYKQSPRFMQIFALIAALLVFCGVFALVLSQREDNLKKEANLPSDQSAIAERIIGESQLLNSHKLKNSLFEQKNQTTLVNKSKKSKSTDASKDAAVRKAFGSLLFSSDNDEVEPDQEENSSDESFDGERSRSRNFNLFLSDNERPEEKTETPNDNQKVMFIERLMGLHFGLQPKFGLSESLVIRKKFGDENASIDEQNLAKSDSEMDLLFNRPNNLKPNSNKMKENKIEDPTPFLLKYAAAAMLSRVLATAQQQAYVQQQMQQQKFREMNDKNIYNSPFKGYRMREPERENSINYMRESMYGRPIHMSHHKHQTRPNLPAGQFASSDRGFSRGPILTNEEAESQQMHPIILMLNIPYREQTLSAPHQLSPHMFGNQQSSVIAHPSIESAIQPIFMPYQASRQNSFYKTPAQLQPQREQSIYGSPAFAHHKNHQSPIAPHPNEGHFTPASHPFNMMQPINRGPVLPAVQRFNHRVTNTIELPIEIHHQVSPSISPVNANQQAQIIVQPQIEAQSQPNENNEQDQSGENEHHMVVFYSDSDNVNHSEENANSKPNNQVVDQQPPVFVKESKQINNDLEKANQISKMLLLQFVQPNAQPQINQQPPVDSNQSEQSIQKPFLINQQELIEKSPKSEKIVQTKKPDNNSQQEMAKFEEDQINRDELFEKESNNQNDNDSEPTPLSHFAQVIRQSFHVIDQQQQQKQKIQPTSQQPSTTQQPNKQIQIQPSESNNQNFQSLPTETENSNKKIETKAQESIQSPAFMLVADNDEN